MSRVIANILHRAIKKDTYNILCMPTHERYETGLAKTGHNFYAWRGPNIKDWNTKFAPIPENYTLLNPQNGDNQLPLDVDIDFILSQNKFGQFNVAAQLSKYLGVPIISLEHTLPVTNWPPEVLPAMKRMQGDVNVFISEFSRKQWGWNENEALVVHHGVDTDTFKPDEEEREKVCLSVVNDWINRDWCCGYKIWTRVTEGLPVAVIGDTPGLSRPAKGTNELAAAYRKARIFVNTSTVSPVPTALLEAMSSGCACVSTATCMIPEIIENGVNGFISNDEKELRNYIQLLLNNPEKAKEIGVAARNTIVDKFGMDNFVNNWNKIFSDLMRKV